MTARRLRAGVIGLGWFGERHARVYASLPHVELVAVSDLDQDRGKAIAGRLGADFHPDAQELLGRSEIEAVSICLPDRQHEAMAAAAAKAGKHLLLEKPLAHTAEAACRIVAACEQAGVRLMVGHILRFDPRYVQLHAAAAPERLGEPIHLRAKRNGTRAAARRLGPATSILFYMGVHDVDMMQWVARSAITRVMARKIERLGTGNEDALYAVVDLANGAIGLLDYSWAWPEALPNGYRASFEVVGTRAAAWMDVTDQGFWTVDDLHVAGGDTHLWPEVQGRIVGDLFDELFHFTTALLSGAPFAQDPREALAAIPVLDALALSAESGAPVEVDRSQTG
jgi:predicted dehydrogenase